MLVEENGVNNLCMFTPGELKVYDRKKGKIHVHCIVLTLATGFSVTSTILSAVPTTIISSAATTMPTSTVVPTGILLINDP